MNLSVDRYHFSEDYSFLGDDERSPLPVEFFQIVSKDFEFWNKDRVSRSISRYKSITDKFEAQESSPSHPMEEDLTSALVSTEDSQSLIEFPDVFRSRVIGEKSVNTLQEWECVITEVDDEIVYSSGYSLINATDEQDVIEVPLAEFNQSDRDQLEPGVVFRLIIGYSKRPSGQRIRESICYVRRALPCRKFELDGINSL